MKPYFVLKILFVNAVSLVLLFSGMSAAQETKRYLVVVADWGKKGPSPEIVRFLAAHENLRLAIAWPAGLTPTEEVKALVKEKRIEPVLTLSDEPLLPLIYEIRISSPIPIAFSWPDDAWDIIARNQAEFYQNFDRAGSGGGLYLRSGMFSAVLVGGCKKLGVRWVNIADETGQKRGAFVRDDFLLLSGGKKTLNSAGEIASAVAASSSPVVPLFFDEHDPLTVQWLSGLEGYLSKHPALVTITPGDVLRELKGSLPGAGEIAQDYTPWLRRPAVWHRLSLARGAIEEYKNSGQAKLKILEAMRDELYHLYDFYFIGRLQDLSAPEDELTFQAGLGNIFKLLNRTPSFRIDESLSNLPSSYSESSFSVRIATDNVSVVNALPEGNGTGGALREFSVSVTPDAIIYEITLGTPTPSGPYGVDVYMDLNNQRGAGLTRFLPGVEAFLNSRDAWEFALRFEKDRVMLYRSGRFEPALLRTFSTDTPLRVEIPRNLLRGNPLRWGYQAVLLEQNGTVREIEDFLCQEDRLRKKLAGQLPVQLPVIRTNQRGVMVSGSQ